MTDTRAFLELVDRPRRAVDPDSAETSFFSFNVPEFDLNCTIQHLVHPDRDLISGGIVLIRGEVENAAFADYIDYHNFVPMPSDDPGDFVYPSGVRVRIVEPPGRVELSYEAPDGRLRFEVRQDAVMPAAAEADGGHFAQAMRTRGQIVLDGERIEVDGYSTRDRCRSSGRAQDGLTASPLAHVGAAFGPDLAFHFSAQDGPGLEPEKLLWGYVWRDGETRPLEAAWMRTRRREDGAAPTGVEVRVVDAAGESYEIFGETRARAPLSVWPDMIHQICLMHYRLNGRQCHGDFRDLQFNSFLRSTRG